MNTNKTKRTLKKNPKISVVDDVEKPKENDEPPKAIENKKKHKQKLVRKLNVKNDNIDPVEQLKKDIKKLNRSEKNIKMIFSGEKKIALDIIKQDLKKEGAVIEALPIYKNDEQVVSIAVIPDNISKKRYTRDDIKRISQNVIKQLVDKGFKGYASVALKYDAFWRAGYFSDADSIVDDGIQLFTFDDYGKESLEEKQGGEFKGFVIYYIPKGEEKGRKGGCDGERNNCLYVCLHKYLNSNLHKVWDKPSKLKKFLGIHKYEKVDIKLMDQIEEKLKVSINVTGDYTHTSTYESNQRIDLILRDGHYECNFVKPSFIKRRISYKERTILLYDYKSFEVYDGTKTKILSKKLKGDIYDFKTDNILVNRTYESKTIQEEYEKYINDAITLKRETKGLINLFKCGSVKNAALHLFERFTKHLKEEQLTPIESMWIYKSSFAALIFADQYEGEGYKYDIRSMYPYLMNGMLQVPLKTGEFKTITQQMITKQNNIYSFGIYRCRVYKSNDENINKLFRFNFNDYYTHISLNHANKLGLKIELTMDGQPNFLHYERNVCMLSHQLFDDYIKTLYPLKEKNIPLAKKILNMLWGALSQVKYIKKIVKKGDKHNIISDIDTLRLRPAYNEEGTKVEEIDNSTAFYKTPFARLCPFLIAKGRVVISDIMEPFIEKVVMCHTDGFIVNTKIDIKTGDKMGELKYIGYCRDCEVVNKIKVNGEFTL